jgi:hypothetical protein
MMWTMAAIAETTHMATVSKNRPTIRPAGIRTGKAEIGGGFDDDHADCGGNAKTDRGA